ncbi:hypothetical protein ACTXT7_004568 [Hymenolepis weldensis]
MNLTHSMESSMPNAVPARLDSEPTKSKQQSVPKSSLLDHQTNQARSSVYVDETTEENPLMRGK